MNPTLEQVSLEELLLLKFAIDNDITELPARPSLDDDPNVWQQHNVVLKIDWESNHEGSVTSSGRLQPPRKNRFIYLQSRIQQSFM